MQLLGRANKHSYWAAMLKGAIYRSNCSMRPKGLFKRMQHVGPTSSNIVVSNMLGPFEHHVGYCCIMLDDVGSSLILFKLFIQHRPTFDEKLVQRHRFHGDLH